MSHPSYAVVYFPIHGRAEPIRLLLASLGLTWTERPVTRDTWLSVKANLPLGQAPVLVEIAEDGAEVQVPQSQAILRHLARRHGAYGRDEAEMLQADVVAETVHDARAVLAPLVAPGARGKDPAALKAAIDEKLPGTLARLEALYGRAPQSQLFVEDRPTWADCLAFDLLDTLDLVWPPALAPFEGLRAFLAAMRALPEISAYVAKRPPSELAPLRGVLESGQAL